jgi:hypothetical protein
MGKDMDMESIEKLLERINLNSPELAAAKSKYEKGDPKGCIDEVIRHFSTRTSPKYLFEKKDMEKFKDDKIPDEAEDVLHHHIFGHQFQNEIDWTFNPTAETSRDNEWSWTLFRNLQWQTLARAYIQTRDEKYAAEFVSELKSFSKAWPAENFMKFSGAGTPGLSRPVSEKP